MCSLGIGSLELTSKGGWVNLALVDNGTFLVSESRVSFTDNW